MATKYHGEIRDSKRDFFNLQTSSAIPRKSQIQSSKTRTIWLGFQGFEARSFSGQIIFLQFNVGGLEVREVRNVDDGNDSVALLLSLLILVTVALQTDANALGDIADTT